MASRFGIFEDSHAVDELKDRIETLNRDLARGEEFRDDLNKQIADSVKLSKEVERVRDEYADIVRLAEGFRDMSALWIPTRSHAKSTSTKQT
jgi:hypothetical protein